MVVWLHRVLALLQPSAIGRVPICEWQEGFVEGAPLLTELPWISGVQAVNATWARDEHI